MKTTTCITPKTLTSLNKAIIIFFALAMLVIQGCTSVKPYQRSYLNDAQMESGIQQIEQFEQGVFNYREGAMTSGTKKGKGGCGCN